MIQTDVWPLLEQYFTKYPDLRATPATEAEIKLAEKALGVTFCESYKKFLLLYGSGGIEDANIYGLSQAPEMPDGYWCVVEQTMAYWYEEWPGVDHWYIVGDDDDNNPVGIDSNGAVWVSDACPDNDQEEVRKVADDFEEFLYRVVTDTLWD